MTFAASSCAVTRIPRKVKTPHYPLMLNEKQEAILDF